MLDSFRAYLLDVGYHQQKHGFPNRSVGLAVVIFQKVSIIEGPRATTPIKSSNFLMHPHATHLYHHTYPRIGWGKINRKPCCLEAWFPIDLRPNVSHQYNNHYITHYSWLSHQDTNINYTIIPMKYQSPVFPLLMVNSLRFPIKPVP